MKLISENNTWSQYELYQADKRYPFQIRNKTLAEIATGLSASKARVDNYNSFDKSFMLFLDGKRAGRIQAKEDDYRDETIGYRIIVTIGI